MSAEELDTTLARLQQLGGTAPAGVPLCMMPDPRGIYRAWSDAHEETERAWTAWKSGPGVESYSAYRAAADREDRAQEWLAQR
jgi:hypothetical protein